MAERSFRVVRKGKDGRLVTSKSVSCAKDTDGMRRLGVFHVSPSDSEGVYHSFGEAVQNGWTKDSFGNWCCPDFKKKGRGE